MPVNCPKLKMNAEEKRVAGITWKPPVETFLITLYNGITNLYFWRILEFLCFYSLCWYETNRWVFYGLKFFLIFLQFNQPWKYPPLSIVFMVINLYNIYRKRDHFLRVRDGCWSHSHVCVWIFHNFLNKNYTDLGRLVLKDIVIIVLTLGCSHLRWGCKKICLF